MTPSYDNALPDGTSRLSKDVEDAYDRVMGPKANAVDEAVRVLTAARKILGDRSMMEAVRRRVAEQKAAVEQSGKRENA